LGFLSRRKPFELTGLVASPDGLYDGSFVAACAQWWNSEVGRRKAVRAAGHQPLSANDVRRLCAVVQPDNRPVLEAVASSAALPGRHSAAVLCLAYAFAVVIAAAAQQPRRSEVAGAWTRARSFTEDDLTELNRHYSDEGAAREYETWEPFWMATSGVFRDRLGEKLIASLRATFDDQVDRWGGAEGIDLRRSIGAPDWSMAAFDEAVRLPNFVELLFEWGGRLRLGEYYLANGEELGDYRFGHDPFDPIEHFYKEALQRYAELATQPDPPISADVKLAVKMAVAWLGDDLNQRNRLGVATAATRGYLWRTVEEGPVEFLEPELTEAIKRSFTVGDDRTADEPLAVTLYFAASQCMADDVKTRLGSIGGLIKGPRSYEKAFWDIASDFAEHGFELDEKTRRAAFDFGVCLADVEHAIAKTNLRGSTVE
jgi:hypothetical protein